MSNSTDKIRDCWKRVVKDNDQKSFEQFFYLLQPKLMRFCMQYLKSKEAVEDIVSDIFVDSWLKRKELAGISNPEIYFLIAVKNKALDAMRKQPGLHLVDIDEERDHLFSFDRPDLALEKKELILSLDKAIESLPIQCRLVFRMVKEEKMKCAEVAQILDISVRTVHTQVYRAMNKLNASMSAYVKSDTQAKIINFISTSLLIVFYFF